MLPPKPSLLDNDKPCLSLSLSPDWRQSTRIWSSPEIGRDVVKDDEAGGEEEPKDAVEDVVREVLELGHDHADRHDRPRQLPHLRGRHAAPGSEPKRFGFPVGAADEISKKRGRRSGGGQPQDHRTYGARRKAVGNEAAVLQTGTKRFANPFVACLFEQVFHLNRCCIRNDALFGHIF